MTPGQPRGPLFAFCHSRSARILCQPIEARGCRHSRAVTGRVLTDRRHPSTPSSTRDTPASQRLQTSPAMAPIVRHDRPRARRQCVAAPGGAPTAVGVGRGPPPPSRRVAVVTTVSSDQRARPCLQPDQTRRHHSTGGGTKTPAMVLPPKPPSRADTHTGAGCAATQKKKRTDRMCFRRMTTALGMPRGRPTAPVQGGGWRPATGHRPRGVWGAPAHRKGGAPWPPSAAAATPRRAHRLPIGYIANPRTVLPSVHS